MLKCLRMIKRGFWLELIERAWQEKPVVWLSGVRRSGKTCLCETLPGVEYFDCELPRTRQAMGDVEGFLDGLKGKRVVLDEVHRLPNPSELLKVAADHYKDTRVLATGSSTLGASAKFRDTLSGRKRDVRLTPMCLPDMSDAGQKDLRSRFLHGGLPPFFLAEELPERDFQDWLDSYWAKDIQELFHLERRASFLKFAELIMARSGGIFEATQFARPCEVSRQTITNYLGVLEATFIAHVVRPFSTHRATEIVSAPKVYAFDTGFVCCFRGWHELRPQDLGPLWEHFVLNELLARLQVRQLLYWRDKRGHELDFVWAPRGRSPLAIECKWSAADFDPANFQAFRRQYPEGDNVVVAQDVARPFERTAGDVRMRFVGLEGLIANLAG